ncbi:MAG TPA: gamma carbonic anhydrase family protein [Methylomirabilota bacterium]|nr:gamma carbonic anhydrase family protein [Methylomirabilota bacterium]
MLLEHQGKRPRVHETAYVAPTATLCGDVTVGPESRVLFGAVLTAEGGAVTIGAHVIVMEQAVIRGTRRHPARVGEHVLIGPRAYLSGCTVEDSVFIATNASIFNGARLETRSEVRINGVVHVNSVVAAGATVPIGWVAVGDPAEILPPQEHERIWAIQKRLNFPGTVFGLERAPEGQTVMPELTRRYGRALGHHRADRVLGHHTSPDL